MPPIITTVTPPTSDDDTDDDSGDDTDDDSGDDTDDDSGDDTDDDSGDDTDDDSDDDTEVQEEFPVTQIPINIDDLYEYRGEMTSDTVWVFIQGGPSIVRDYTLNDAFTAMGISKSGEETHEKNEYYPQFTDDLVVYPYQSQQINSARFNDYDLTFEQAKEESLITVEITRQVVEEFVNREKVVYLIGHSYGSLVINELLSQHGPIAHKTISLNGRLDMDEEVWKGYSQGDEWKFDSDGLNPYKLKESSDIPRLIVNLNKIAAGLAFNRYSEKLSDVDLSSTIFITANKDEQVGVFNEKEINFLRSKQLAKELIILDGGHSLIFEETDVMKDLYNVITFSDQISDNLDGSGTNNVDGSGTNTEEDKEIEYAEFVHPKIPSENEGLYEYIGDMTSDTVWVFVQGGPETKQYQFFNEGKAKGIDPYPFITDDLVVYPYQSQQINSSRFEQFDLTFEQAKKEGAISVEIVKLVVQEFVDKEKVVYLIGHSYGSLIINELLSLYGPLADKTVSLNGRLNMDQEVWEGFSVGEYWRYDTNGVNPSKTQNAEDFSRQEKNLGKLAAGMAYHRFIDKLADVNLSTTIFLTATKDDQAGTFNEQEISFLKGKDLAHDLIILEGEHSDALQSETMKKLHNLIINPNSKWE